ncbi:hypothetical protein DY000_02010682 [Brassica cretica]|uniref:Uncharacterized protein n=1 Tax=Brassica cretica TaxID=69181 RepID=A0ABQ7CI76_BRACR|nr:hypothetical protein DY000_02010682 [Brassica cretica]
MLKAQVNILELEKPSNQVAELSILKDSDQVMWSLNRAMKKQERVQKQFELKVNHLNDLLTKEIDRRKLLENQLADNLKRVRMLTTGTTTLDHLLTIGQCPSSSWGLGFQGSTSKSAEETVFMKGKIESLSDEESSDDNPEDPTVAAETPKNRSKEHRYEESRSVYQTKAQYYPEFLRPLRLPLTAKFISIAATERYKDLRGRKFIAQQCISLTDDSLSDVKRVVTGAGLIHTLNDTDPYQPNVVREFIANLLDAKEQDDGVAVYVRGSLVDFSPSLINVLYCIPGFEEDPN